MPPIYTYFPTSVAIRSLRVVTFKIQYEYALTCLAYICLIPFTSRLVQVLENNLDAEKVLFSLWWLQRFKDTFTGYRDRTRKCKTF